MYCNGSFRSIDHRYYIRSKLTSKILQKFYFSQKTQTAGETPPLITPPLAYTRQTQVHAHLLHFLVSLYPILKKYADKCVHVTLYCQNIWSDLTMRYIYIYNNIYIYIQIQLLEMFHDLIVIHIRVMPDVILPIHVKCPTPSQLRY